MLAVANERRVIAEQIIIIVCATHRRFFYVFVFEKTFIGFCYFKNSSI